MVHGGIQRVKMRTAVEDALGTRLWEELGPEDQARFQTVAASEDDGLGTKSAWDGDGLRTMTEEELDASLAASVTGAASQKDDGDAAGSLRVGRIARRAHLVDYQRQKASLLAGGLAPVAIPRHIPPITSDRVFDTLDGLGIGLELDADDAFDFIAALQAAALPRDAAAEPRLGACQVPFTCTRVAADDTVQASINAAVRSASRLYGSLFEILDDLRELGVGTVRRLHQCDLWWEGLSPDTECVASKVPSPTDMLTYLRANGYAAFDGFKQLALLAGAHGITLTPTLFCSGPANAANQGGDGKDQIPGTTVEYTDLLDAAPATVFRTLMVPSGYGWDAWYWDWTRADWPAGVPGPVDGLAADLVTLVTADTYANFAMYATNVYIPPDSDNEAYLAEVARRKALGLAAYSTGVAEFLARLSPAILLILGKTLAEVIPVIELGNEMNVFWDTADPMSSGQIDAGRYLALLAAPIAQARLGVRFRLPEVDSWMTGGHVDADNAIDARANFVTHVLTEMDAELTRWGALVSGVPDALTSADEITAWTLTCAATATDSETVATPFAWPSAAPTVTVGDLAHQIGFHWFHCWNFPDPSIYYPLAQLIDEAQELLAACPSPMEISCGAVGFVAEATEEADHAYTDTNERFQAQMVVRLMLGALAAGVAVANCFTWMDKPATDSGGYGAMGLRDDVYDGESYDRATDAWRRSAWYAIQRLASLTVQATTIRVTRAGDDRIVILRLDCATVFDLSSLGLPAAYHRLWIVWLDQIASSPAVTVQLTADGVATIFDYSLVPLIPHVDRPATSTAWEGYPTGETLDWEWTDIGGWNNATPSIHLDYWDPSANSVAFEVARASPRHGAGLFCIATDCLLSVTT